MPDTPDPTRRRIASLLLHARERMHADKIAAHQLDDAISLLAEWFAAYDARQSTLQALADEILALDAQATPGPWVNRPDPGPMAMWVVPEGWLIDTVGQCPDPTHPDTPQHIAEAAVFIPQVSNSPRFRENARLIARYRKAAPDLARLVSRIHSRQESENVV
jgi:hypothetical protein